MTVESQKLSVESQKRVVALRSGFRLLTFRSRLRARGVTLIELLIVIMIISILAALVLGVAAVAGETARQAQTRHLVERLHTLLTEHYNTYKTRRVKLRVSDSVTKGIEDQINAKLANPAARNQALAEARLYAMRELMLMEVPDRWSDVLLTDVGAPGQNDDDPTSPNLPTVAKVPVYLAGRTELSNVYLRRYANLVGRTNTLTEVANTAGDIKRNQGAECLYMFITLACGDGEARSLFKEADFGDTDGDGAPEFLDGWGHPINFLRWAPGFDSQIELNANNLQTTDSSQTATYWTTQASKDHDPFDLYRRDAYAFRLVPLIYSPGRDEASGLAVATGYVTWINTNSTLLSINTSSNSPPYITSPVLNPYVKVGTTPAYIGSDIHLVDPGNNPDPNATDNVHNHLLGQR